MAEQCDRVGLPRSTVLISFLRLHKEERGRCFEEASKKAQEAMEAAKKRLIHKKKQERLGGNQQQEVVVGSELDNG